MPSADLKLVLSLRARRGPSGKTWFDAERSGRKFVAFEVKSGDLVLYERVGHPVLDEPEPETGARSDAPPRQPARKLPKRMRRELTSMGLIEATDHPQEIT